MREIDLHINALECNLLKEYQILLLLPDCAKMPPDSLVEEFRMSLEDLGYDFLYIPTLIPFLKEDVVGYFIPGLTLDRIPSADRLQEKLAERLGIKPDAPAAISVEEGNLHAFVSEQDGISAEDFLFDFLHYLKCGYTVNINSVFQNIRTDYEDELSDTVLSSPCSPPLPERDYYVSSPCVPDEEYRLETLIDELKEIKESQLRSLGLSESALRFILGIINPKLSAMRITRNSKILLADYSNLEIKLDDKTKALYFLFLRHSEGLSIKSLTEHRNELLDLYQSISGRDDPSAMEKTIDNLCDPFQNNANISLSRIKKAFCEAMTPQIASRYYVDGDRGGLRTVSLDRRLVTWETIR